jgi:DNA-binding transcriptional MerR regulator
MSELLFTMGQVAAEAGVYKNTLKTWEEKGKIDKAKRERGGNHARMYTRQQKDQIVAYAKGRKELVEPTAISEIQATA